MIRDSKKQKGDSGKECRDGDTAAWHINALARATSLRQTIETGGRRKGRLSADPEAVLIRRERIILG